MSDTNNPLYELEMKVRDYECDIQQIVNNAVYQNYFEHTRHEFLRRLGVNFPSLSRRGIDLVVVHAEIDYHWPLHSGDLFVVTLDIGRCGPIKYIFQQNIFLLPKRRRIVTGVFHGASVSKGRPIVVPEVTRALSEARKLL